MEEIWKPIVNFEKYEISNLGNVRNSKRNMTIKVSADGYLQVSLVKNGKQSTRSVHREMLKAFVGCPDEKLQVRHLDGNSKNNSFANLAWGTASENNFDKIAHGTSLKGVLSPTAKLNENSVIEIFNSKLSSPKLAKIYGISQTAISKIKLKKTWTHITNGL